MSDQELHAVRACLQRVEAAIRAARVQRDPRHRISMLTNDWDAIVTALADASAENDDEIRQRWAKADHNDFA